MKTLSSIQVHGAKPRRIELLQGDLTELGEGEGFDLLVVSAFPDDYLPTRTSLIGALHRKGLSVADLAQDKSVDLRDNFACWLSKPVTPTDPGLRFSRILCFEPSKRGAPPEVVGDIFRALMPILAEAPDINSIALPIVAAGNQGCSVAEMLPPLLDAALGWLEKGLPLDCIKIVTLRDAQAAEAERIFNARKLAYLAPRPAAAAPMPPPLAGDDFLLGGGIDRGGASDGNFRSMDSGIASPDTAPAPALETPPPAEPEYDVFISYSRKNAHDSEMLEKTLRRLRPEIRIFVDRKNLDVGCAWQIEIFESLDKCRKLVAMLSPEYIASKVCKEEFNIAWLRGREADDDIIFPLYLYSAPLPTYMKYKNFLDCREGDAQRIEEASRRLLETLFPPAADAAHP
ncbi:toll/interleukin-1 receptor domain-containing protein [Zoogloea sp.]|uniref:toll/interleukin-1 receptor domain-containing protein n=1 Tax=Zoogloea sp. TaxID=49181 RepID=UPI0026353006|nr:toll/interleukin-1 receptor domain-containing protein [Zoogloea sp.]